MSDGQTPVYGSFQKDLISNVGANPTITRTAVLNSQLSINRRDCLASLGAFTLVSACSGSPTSGSLPSGTLVSVAPPPNNSDSSPTGLRVFTPEQFGAAADGSTNDTDAFTRMSAAVNLNGGGSIVLQRKTYIVGGHVTDPTGTYSFGPATIMTFDGCSQGIEIHGNGAKLKCADGLRFGTFDATTGQPTSHPLPYTEHGEVASPYQAMIFVQNCAGDIYIENVELDGNLAGLQLGGQFGDTGWQIPCHGLRLWTNQGNERVVNVHTHHHALDGVLIGGVVGRTTKSSLESITSEYNARQACSIVSGSNYSFLNSHFNHAGRGAFMSAPGAGVDLESEYGPIRAIAFSGCEFSNNSGAGLISDVGDTAGVTLDTCSFVGTTTWSVWPRMPGFRFTSCQFVGALCNAFANPDPALATQFSKCSFLDDAALSPTGEVYRPTEAAANLANSKNVLFDGCQFDLRAELVLPWSWEALYNNCTMSQLSTVQSHPKGTYTGVCKIKGNAELYGAIILGDVTLNGQVVPRTSQ